VWGQVGEAEGAALGSLERECERERESACARGVREEPERKETDMGWLRLVDSYTRDYILQKRSVILKSLLIIAIS